MCGSDILCELSQQNVPTTMAMPKISELVWTYFGPHEENSLLIT